MTLTWQHGRQLASMTDGTNTYEYVYYGGLLQYMEYNNTPVYFTHAPDGTPMGMLTGGQAYFYVLNLQGDKGTVLLSSCLDKDPLSPGDNRTVPLSPVPCYSSVQPFTNGMIVRNWLAGQSFSAQYEFGINVIKMFM